MSRITYATSTVLPQMFTSLLLHFYCLFTTQVLVALLLLHGAITKLCAKPYLELFMRFWKPKKENSRPFRTKVYFHFFYFTKRALTRAHTHTWHTHHTQKSTVVHWIDGEKGPLWTIYGGFTRIYLYTGFPPKVPALVLQFQYLYSHLLHHRSLLHRHHLLFLLQSSLLTSITMAEASSPRHQRCFSTSTLPPSPSSPTKPRTRPSHRSPPAQKLRLSSSPRSPTKPPPKSTSTPRSAVYSGSPNRSYSVSSPSSPSHPSSSTRTFSTSLPKRIQPPLPPSPLEKDDPLEPSVTRPSERGASSPCSPTSTTHLAKPEWASPDLSFRSYVDQISTESAPVWTKRSLSMSTLTPFPFTKSSKAPKIPGIAENVTVPRRFGSFHLSPKRQRQSISRNDQSLTVATTCSSEEHASENSDSENCYFIASPKRHSSTVKSIYISFPSIDDEEEDDAESETAQQLHRQQQGPAVVV